MAQIDTADEAQQQPPRVYAEDFPEAVVDGVEKFLGKPRARGWIHVYSAVVAFIAGRRAGVGVVGRWNRPAPGWPPCSTPSRSWRCSPSAAPITG